MAHEHRDNVEMTQGTPISPCNSIGSPLPSLTYQERPAEMLNNTFEHTPEVHQMHQHNGKVNGLAQTQSRELCDERM